MTAIHQDLRAGTVLLVRDPGATWITLQERFEGYVTSLGPWPCGEIVEWCDHEYGPADEEWPWRRQAIEQFVTSPQRSAILSSEAR